MSKINIIKVGLSKIFAITEKNLKLKLHDKLGLAFSVFMPILNIIMPIILLGQFFEYNARFGEWNKDNYLVYLYIAYNVFLLHGIIGEYPTNFRNEKYWETLPALIIAPFNRFSLIIGILLSHLTIIAIPLTIFFIICYIYYPISFFTVLFVLLIYILIALIFNGLGIILGSFYISKEKLMAPLAFAYNIIFWLSCITYPYEIYPKPFQFLMNLNPFYYIFDILRLAWIEDNFIISITSHPYHLIILIICASFLPFIGIFIFNKIYRKYGIVGY